MVLTEDQLSHQLTLYTRMTTIVIMNIGTVNYEYYTNSQLRAISALYLVAA